VEGTAFKQFLPDSLEAVIAEVLKLLLSGDGEPRDTAESSLGGAYLSLKLTFVVTSSLHYFNINFINLAAIPSD
jgi:putative lipoic acid-binding regulatory protein